MINEGIINATVQTSNELESTIQTAEKIDGTVTSSGALDGTVTSTGELDGSVTSTNAIEGSLNNIGVNAVMNEADPIFKSSPAYGITSSDINYWNNKEDEIIALTNIELDGLLK